MGIQDRDYYRENSNSFLDAWGRQGAVVWLIVITSVLFCVQLMTGNVRSELFELGKYSYEKVLSGEIWRLLTPLFLHLNFFHLFVNMLALYCAGSRLEELYGSREIVLYYLVAGVFAQVVYLIAQAAKVMPPTDAIGASGAVTAILVLFAIHYPNQKVLLFFVIPVPAWMLVFLFIAIDLLGAFGAGRNDIGYIAHLGGALFGFLYYRSGLRFGALFARSPKTLARRPSPPLRLQPVDPIEEEEDEPVGAAVENQPHAKEATEENLEAKLDRVLEKLSQKGQENLTPEEREILVQASEVYKKRRK
jgi:membrane associated rhomboid family serine protease